jgi:dienelactone hydrolase
MEALRKAASLENFFLRVGDIRAVLDQLQAWNKNGALANRMDLTRIGMSGHSFGAVTTQAVTGETFVMSGTELTDPRIRAAVIMSPSTPKSETAERAFGDVKIPWLEQKTSRRLARRMRMRGSRYIPRCTACRNIRSCSTMPIIRSSPIGRCPAIAAGAT